MSKIAAGFYFLIPLVLIFSCKKQEESCGTDMILLGADSVYEGETIELTPLAFPTGGNVHFNWEFPDMTPFPTGIDAYGADPVKVTNASIFDEGLYSFRAFPKTSGCPDVVTAAKYVKVLALPCPCCEEIYENNLKITTWQGEEIVMPFNPIFDSDFDTTQFSISNWQSSGPYYIDLAIKTRLGDRSRTFKLINSISYWTGSGIPEDKNTQAWLNVDLGTEPADTYLMEEGVNNLYVRHDGDQVTLNFCNVVFRNKYYANKYYTVSGKVYLEF